MKFELRFIAVRRCNSKEAVRWGGGRGGWDSDTDMFLLSGEGGPCFNEKGLFHGIGN